MSTYFEVRFLDTSFGVLSDTSFGGISAREPFYRKSFIVLTHNRPFDGARDLLMIHCCSIRARGFNGGVAK